MVIGEVLRDKIKNLFSGKRLGSGGDDVDDLDDYETRDKQLRAMRRLRRRQMDLVEKDYLRKVMVEFQRSKDKKDFFGESLFQGSISRKSQKKSKQVFMGKSGFL